MVGVRVGVVEGVVLAGVRVGVWVGVVLAGVRVGVGVSRLGSGLETAVGLVLTALAELGRGVSRETVVGCVERGGLQDLDVAPSFEAVRSLLPAAVLSSSSNPASEEF